MLVPTEEVAETVECKPTSCRRCGQELSGEDAEPLRHQVAEIPPIKPHVIEYRRHRLRCPHCGTRTLAPLPEGVPTGAFGPRSSAMLAMLSGGYRLGKRSIQQLVSDLLGLSISTGMIARLERKTSHLLAQPAEDILAFIRSDGVVGMDETDWRENRKKAWLWVPTTPMAAIFRTARSHAWPGCRRVDIGTSSGPRGDLRSVERLSKSGRHLADVLGSSAARLPSHEGSRWRKPSDRRRALGDVEHGLHVVASVPSRRDLSRNAGDLHEPDSRRVPPATGNRHGVFVSEDRRHLSRSVHIARTYGPSCEPKVPSRPTTPANEPFVMPSSGERFPAVPIPRQEVDSTNASSAFWRPADDKAEPSSTT